MSELPSIEIQNTFFTSCIEETLLPTSHQQLNIFPLLLVIISLYSRYKITILSFASFPCYAQIRCLPSLPDFEKLGLQSSNVTMHISKPHVQLPQCCLEQYGLPLYIVHSS